MEAPMSGTSENMIDEQDQQTEPDAQELTADAVDQIADPGQDTGKPN